MNKLIKLFPVMVGLMLAGVAGTQFMDAGRDNVHARAVYVKTMCDRAHNEFNATTEKACGDAQDSANAEYLCNSGNFCWVETK